MGDEKGAGKDRTEAKNFVKQNIQDLLKQEVFKKMMDENEVVFVISSTGGGTGSGMTPVLTEILSKIYSTKRFIIVEIYPPIRESVAAQQNSIEYLKEIKQFIPNSVYMSYDNNKRANKPTSEMMEEINIEIVEDICVLRGDYQYPTPYTSIDEKDALKLLETPGRLSVVKLYGLKEKDLDDKSIEDMIIYNLKNTSVGVELERDRIVKRMGLITNLNDKLHKALDTNMTQLKDFVGEPVEGFEHIMINKDPEDPNRVIVILAGMSVPDDRIQKMLQRIEEATEQLTKVKSSSILDDAQTDLIKSLRDTSAGKTDPADIDLNETFNKYFQ
jgi:cell division GTPase FtsZ